MKDQVKNHIGIKFLFIAFALTLIFILLSITTYAETNSEEITDYKSKISLVEETITCLEIELEN